ncbi:adenylyl-sulfate kinase [Paucisalibacillus sp. EB02]|uniref:adenylyl-sulfate kinase n=1 Tax=Paucisalibacillus sp. EB02 TaxID=1347087 RepID=UPI0004ACBB95|nr:adenylyl-sulfate kinase [Paucisalibacillus sp. EB02]
MPDNNSDGNIFYQPSTITKEDRQTLHGHKSVMLWFTGLSGSGKSTIADRLQYELINREISVYILDGDNLRRGINKNLSFSVEDRRENNRITAEIGKILVDAGLVVIAALISPFEEDRQNARAIFNSNEFIEVYVKCTLEECEKRDPKGLYNKARKGEIKKFTGIDQAYEEPKNPDITIDTSELSIEQSVQKLVSFLFNKVGLNQI